MKPAIREWMRGLGDVVFPPACVACRGIVPSDAEFRHVCPRCARQLERVSPPHCPTCGHPFYGDVEEGRLCPHCEGLAPAFREGRTAVRLKGPGRALVHELKYHAGLHVVADLERIFRGAAHVLELARDGVLIPVPLHPRKLRERGYNQSELIAEALLHALDGRAEVRHLLARVVDTETQTHHDRRRRQANLKNAFAVAKGATITPAQHYLLVDDVFTTGSTLNSCALALRQAGAVCLDVVTFGHG